MAIEKRILPIQYNFQGEVVNTKGANYHMFIKTNSGMLNVPIVHPWAAVGGLPTDKMLAMWTISEQDYDTDLEQFVGDPSEITAPTLQQVIDAIDAGPNNSVKVRTVNGQEYYQVTTIVDDFWPSDTDDTAMEQFIAVTKAAYQTGVDPLFEGKLLSGIQLGILENTPVADGGLKEE